MSFSFVSRASLFVLFALGSLTFACSSGTTSTGGGDGGSPSSSSGPKLGGYEKAKTCKNPTLNKTRDPDDACDLCTASKCEAEGAALIGTDPNAFGGACADLLTCTCDCTANDTACKSTCGGKGTEACSNALNAALACEKAKCAAECAKDGG